MTFDWVYQISSLTGKLIIFFRVPSLRELICRVWPLSTDSEYNTELLMSGSDYLLPWLQKRGKFGINAWWIFFFTMPYLQKFSRAYALTNADTWIYDLCHASREQDREIWQFVCGSTATLTASWRNSWSITGQAHDVNLLILANQDEIANYARDVAHLYFAWIPEVVSYSIFYNLLIREPFCWASICTLKSDTLAYQIKVNCYQQIILIHSVVKAHLASNRTEPPAHVSGNGQQM